MSTRTWDDLAACRQPDLAPEDLRSHVQLWFPRKGQTAVKARRVCASCPVLAQCLEYAITAKEQRGILGGANWRLRRRLYWTWVQRSHDYRADCMNPSCRWCRAVDAHRASLVQRSGPMQLNGPGATCGYRSKYARGCRCPACSLAISPVGRKLSDAGVVILEWWERWFGPNPGEVEQATKQRLLFRAKRLAEFDAVETAA